MIQAKDKSGFLEANGGRHYYEVAGQGSPVVFIPGFTLDTRMWDDQFDVFAERHRAVRYDLRGTGRSDPPKGPYSYGDDIEALLDHLGIDRAHLVGLSLGGGIAIDFALTHGARVRSLVLVAASAVAGYPWAKEIDDWFVEIGAAARRGDMEEAKRLWLATGWFTSAMTNPRTAAKLREIMGDYSGWHLAHKNPVVRPAPPANDRLQDVAAPTFIVTGALDTAFYNLPLAEHLAASIPGSRSLTISGAGHMLNMEAPMAFNTAALAFLTSVDAANRNKTKQ
jgi:pimeloyl-ACP methyl ester carboxylesterase